MVFSVSIGIISILLKSYSSINKSFIRARYHEVANGLSLLLGN